MAEPPGPWGLIPPSHFMLPPPSTRALEAELEAERRRSHILKAELEAERGRSLMLGAELEALKGRGQARGAEKPLEEDPQKQLLGRWRREVFALLLQRMAWGETEKALRAKVLALEAAVAAATQREKKEAMRAEAAEKALGALGRAAARVFREVSRRQAEVTAATQALGTLSSRLGRATNTIGHLRLVAEVTRRTVAEDMLETSGKGHLGTPRTTGLVPTVVAEEVTPEEVTEDQVLSGDGTEPPPGRAALALLVTQLQALGATILGDTGDIGDTS